MTAANFDAAFEFVQRKENGGAPFHVTPGDKGGATAWDVTWETFVTWRTRYLKMGKPTINDLRAFKQADAKPLYLRMFWNSLLCNLMPSGPDFEVFDMEVGSGPAPAVDLLQEALGFAAEDVDGIVGPKTLEALTACADLAGLIDRMGELETAFYHRIPSDRLFDGGWERRASERHALAKSLIVRTADPDMTIPQAVAELERASA